MRFPFALTKKIASHIIKHKVRKTPKFAMVLQLEPLHTCNLTCTGCGGVNASKTVSPLDFFMPGLIKADLPTAPTPVTATANEFATVQ